jgi:hypothetical protein
LLTESARDVFRPHALVRLFLRELAEAELSGAERDVLLTDSLRYYRPSRIELAAAC